MNKEVRKTIKKMKEFADPVTSFTVIKGKHNKILWEMEDDFGKTVHLTCILPITPSCHRWKKNHARNVRRIFREKNITREVPKF